jgi:hypothetical protein
MREIAFEKEQPIVVLEAARHIRFRDEDGRQVFLYDGFGGEGLAYEVARWYAHFQHVTRDMPRCPFCNLPVMPFEDGVLEDPPAHPGCAADSAIDRWKAERDEQLDAEMESRLMGEGPGGPYDGEGDF